MKTAFHPRRVYIAASYMAPVGRYNGKEREACTFLELAEKAAAVFASSPVRPRDIEAVVVGSQNPGAFSGVDNTAAKVAGVLGISGAKSVLIDTASSSGASAFENAYMEIASGRSDHVLAMGIQKMSDVSTWMPPRLSPGSSTGTRRSSACPCLPAAHWCPVSHAAPESLRGGMDGLLGHAHRTAHRFAARNPDAHLNFQIPVDEYYRQIVNGKNYMYWWPLRYHDFCPMSDGVAAVILTARPQEVMVTGVGSATDIPTIADRRYFQSFPATVRAAAAAYGMAGIKDITTFAGKLHVNMHDPLTASVPSIWWIWVLSPGRGFWTASSMTASPASGADSPPTLRED